MISGPPAYLQAEAASRLAGFLPASELAALEGIGARIKFDLGSRLDGRDTSFVPTPYERRSAILPQQSCGVSSFLASFGR